MNDKAKCKNCTDKMIEEMAKLDIEESAGFYSAFINDMRISKNKPLSISKTVMSFDCPKKYILQAIGIPEGSVVLSREEYEILINQNKGLKEENHTLRLENNDLEAQVEQARKETAKEILQSLLDFVNCEKINQGHSFEKIKKTLIKVAKTYEVEVEE